MNSPHEFNSPREFSKLSISAIVILLLFAVGMIVVDMLVPHKAKAHSFYPAECCSDRDCWPMGDGEREPEPKAMHSGWVMSDGNIIPYHEARPSPDGRFHICRQHGLANGSLIRPHGRPVCLFTPQMGS